MKPLFLTILASVSVFCGQIIAAEPLRASVKQESKAWPEPPIVEPKYDGSPVKAPEGAIIIFNGSDASSWAMAPNKKDAAPTHSICWKIENGYMEVPPKTRPIKPSTPPADSEHLNIETVKPFITSGHLHIEWATPSEVKGSGQGRGNSGVFIEGLPELQVLDSYNNKTYFDGQAGAFYKQRPPSVNACRGPGLWQCYDIHLTRATVEKGKVIKPATVTVFHNKILVQDHVEFSNPTQAGTLKLQDHNNPVRFRNIWFMPAPKLTPASISNTKP